MNRLVSLLLLLVSMFLLTGETMTLDELMTRADNGSNKAQFHLGIMYYDGNMVPQNSEKAFNWYIKSAEQGFALAQFTLFEMYEQGIGVKTDIVRAIFWLEKCAFQDFPESQIELGSRYIIGAGVPVNFVKASYWIKSRMMNGDEGAHLLWDIYELWKYDLD